MRSQLERWAGDLPVAEGSHAVSAVLSARGELWELALVRPGGQPAARGEAEAVARTLRERVEADGFELLFEPSVALGGELAWSGDFERVAAPAGAQLRARRRGRRSDQPFEAVKSLDASRKLTERSVLELGEGLQGLLNLADSQHQQVMRVASRFDSDGGLGEAVAGMEERVGVVGKTLEEALARYTRDVEAASTAAKDIAKLALTVGQIAQSARVLTFNARVESARLGDAGKGFIVIANAIRELANDVQGSNTLVGNLASSLVTSLPELQRSTTRLAETSQVQLDAVRERLVALRSSFQEAREGAVAELKATERNAASLQERSHEVVQHLQFQDRSDQLLARVKDQVEAMEAALGIAEGAAEGLLERVGDLGRTLTEPGETVQPGSIALF